VRARGMVSTVEHPSCGEIKLVSPPVKYSENQTGIRSPPPTLGQHTETVLTELLGVEGKEVQRLKELGVVA